jgi:hypothetical protein
MTQYIYIYIYTQDALDAIPGIEDIPELDY